MDRRDDDAVQQLSREEFVRASPIYRPAFRTGLAGDGKVDTGRGGRLRRRFGDADADSQSRSV